MDEGQISGSDGRFQIGGELSFATVGAVLAESRGKLFGMGTQPLRLDLGEVSRADSAGLALLLQWMRMARSANREIRFHNLPQQLLTIARACELDDLLPVVG